MSHNKKRNKEIRKKFELEKEILENPNICFCEELGLEPDYDSVCTIGNTEPIDGFPFPHSKGYSQEIYLCKRCGKEYTIRIAFA